MNVTHIFAIEELCWVEAEIIRRKKWDHYFNWLQKKKKGHFDTRKEQT